jgi:formylglycine-generating enzyme required for sulfatase activity
MISDFHRRNVRVLFPMMMWDQGTRAPDAPWPDAIARLMRDVGADGINGDTEFGVSRAFVEASDRVGWESWENVWGIWNGVSERDGEAVRRMAMIERAVAPFLVSQQWQPFYPMMRQGVFASRWPLGDQTVWTIVNRNDYDVSGPQMVVPKDAGARYFDLYRGTEVQPVQIPDGSRVLALDIEGKGFTAILATKGEPAGAIEALMAQMRVASKRPLSKYSSQSLPLTQTMVPIAATKPSTTAPADMIRIPSGQFMFVVSAVELEGAHDAAVDVQYPWESSPRRNHMHLMQVSSFWIDKYPVTNEAFKKFMDATQYHPKDALNFLRDWKDGTYPEGWSNKPVTWVSREDAEAYAQWAGKRLPHEWEWQYAAQGSDGRLYPWGNEMDAKAVPTPDTGRTMRGPDDVNAHPSGASPLGVMDLVGNVWQWTSEFMDEHTRGAPLRGGSYYQPQGSVFYFPQAYKLTEHNRYLLTAPSLDRSGAVGFRCVVDYKGEL